MDPAEFPLQISSGREFSVVCCVNLWCTTYKSSVGTLLEEVCCVLLEEFYKYTT